MTIQEIVTTSFKGNEFIAASCSRCFRNFKPSFHIRYDNPSNGRILCTACHIQDEIKRGSNHSAALLRRTQSIRTWSWQKTHK